MHPLLLTALLAAADAGALRDPPLELKGAENVMWWTLTSGTASLSDDQGWVLRRGPTTC